MFLISVVLTVNLGLILSLYHWTGAAQILNQALLMVLPEGIQVNQELPILELVLTIYTLLIQVRSGVYFRVLARDVVEQRMSHQRLFLPGNRSNSPWLSWLEPICVRGLARESVFSSGV
jgi:hypothetical protein